MSDQADQALRVLDAIEGALRAGHVVRGIQDIGGGRVLVRVYSSETGREAFHKGGGLLDALSQYAQAVVSGAEPWGEPGEFDAESDVDAFDRACGSGP